MGWQQHLGLLGAPPIGGVGGADSLLIDADGEKIAFLTRIMKAGTLAKLAFYTKTVTTGDDLKVSFQDVDMANGEPDEVVDQYRVVTIANGDDSVWKTTGIISSDGTDGGAKRTVAVGDWLAIVLEFDAYVAGDLNLAKGYASSTYLPLGQDLLLLKTGGSWAIQSSRTALMALEYDDGSYYFFPAMQPYAAASETFNMNSNPDERGCIFQLPFPCKIRGYRIGVDADAACDAVLYDADGSSVLASTSLESDVRVGTGMVAAYGPLAEQILNANSDYRLALKPTTGNNVSLRVGTFPSSAARGQWGYGTNMQYTSRVNGGSWTETATKVALLEPIISAIGCVPQTHPGMSGGMRG